MVKKIVQQNQALYQCEACDFEYKELENAQRCEAFCREHKSCSTEIAKHAIFDNRSIETSSEKEQNFLLSDLPVVVDFWAPWCPWCMKLMPVFDEITKERQIDANFVKINVEENPDLAAKLDVMSIPTIKVFSKGIKIGELFGYMQKEKLVSEINKILSKIQKESKHGCC